MQNSTIKLKRVFHKSENWGYDGDGRFELRVKKLDKKIKSKELRLRNKKLLKELVDCV